MMAGVTNHGRTSGLGVGIVSLFLEIVESQKRKRRAKQKSPKG